MASRTSGRTAKAVAARKEVTLTIGKIIRLREGNQVPLSMFLVLPRFSASAANLYTAGAT